MSSEFKHKALPWDTKLNRKRWQAEDAHEADGETTGDIIHFDGTNWKRTDTLPPTVTVGGITTHAADASAHHIKYTDAEVDAILAVHTALAAAHHARYTTAEAVAAAKTVKLDDLTTPDDNADLNSSTSTHGLLKKLDNVATNFMDGQGNWSVPTGVGNVEVGTYTGDGTSSRMITCGFQPKIVFVFGLTEETIWFSMYTQKGWAIDNAGSVSYDEGTGGYVCTRYPSAGDYFYCGINAIGANVSTQLYYYAVIG